MSNKRINQGSKEFLIEYRKNYGNMIRSRRTSFGVSLLALSKMSNVPIDIVLRIEEADITVDRSDLERVVVALGTLK